MVGFVSFPMRPLTIRVAIVCKLTLALKVFRLELLSTTAAVLAFVVDGLFFLPLFEWIVTQETSEETTTATLFLAGHLVAGW